MTRALYNIVAAVCAASGVSVDDLLSRRRHRRVVLAREAVVILARSTTDASYPEIAMAIGSANHSTVITAYRRVERRVESRDGPDDAELYRIVKAASVTAPRVEVRVVRVGGRGVDKFLRSIGEAA